MTEVDRRLWQRARNRLVDSALLCIAKVLQSFGILELLSPRSKIVVRMKMATYHLIIIVDCPKLPRE